MPKSAGLAWPPGGAASVEDRGPDAGAIAVKPGPTGARTVPTVRSSIVRRPPNRDRGQGQRPQVRPRVVVAAGAAGGAAVPARRGRRRPRTLPSRSRRESSGVSRRPSTGLSPSPYWPASSAARRPSAPDRSRYERFWPDTCDRRSARESRGGSARPIPRSLRTPPGTRSGPRLRSGSSTGCSGSWAASRRRTPQRDGRGPTSPARRRSRIS